MANLSPFFLSITKSQDSLSEFCPSKYPHKYICKDGKERVDSDWVKQEIKR